MGEKIFLKEAIQLSLRGFQLFFHTAPKLFLARAAYAITMGTVPYVNIYLSAQLVGELAGDREIDRLVALVITLLLSNLFLLIFSESVKHWMMYENSANESTRELILFRKLLSMDFVDMDSSQTHDRLDQIDQNANWAGWGLGVLPKIFENSLRAIISIICAVSLTVGMFFQKVPESAGRLKVLNHPVCIVAMLLFMIGVIAAASIMEGKAEQYYAKCAVEARFGNRSWGFFGFEVIELERAVDMRIYNQQNLSANYLLKNDSFQSNSMMGRLVKGRMGLLYAFSSIISSSFQGIIYLFVCMKAWAGAFGVGLVTQYIGAVSAFYSGVVVLFQAVARLKSNAIFLKIIFEFLDVPNQMYQGSLTVEKRSDHKYEIEFRNVSFHYPSSKEWALKNINFRFRVGERLAIVGENGSGKTTFIKLLCRLYDPTEGEILLNGIDIRKYDYREYMSVFAVVFQDFQLLSGSLMDNVAAGCSGDSEKVRKCLMEAGFGDRLSSLPKGLETCLHKDFDKDAVIFSGGEKQKIALARALYKDAPFIVLDEPTAALDPVAEQEVYEKFNEIAGDKTTIYISHRLSSCRFCDKIAVFDKGSIVQYGNHESLLQEKKRKYYTLWHAQAQYYTEEKRRKEELDQLRRNFGEKVIFDE